MIPIHVKDTLAKIAILLWIILLISLTGYIVQIAITFNVNTFFGISNEQSLSKNIIQEVQVILMMFAISITGGISFMIKDFYRSIKYSNLYSMAWDDYRANRIPFEEFQRLTPIEVYTGRFNYTWIYWFIIQPILSSILGVIAFFIARSGLGVLQGTTTQGDLSIQSLYLYAVLTFLAGFSSHKFIAWLDRLADKIFSTTLPDRFQETKTQIQSTALNDRTNLKSTFGLQSEVSTDIIHIKKETLLENNENKEDINSSNQREDISSKQSFEKKPLKTIR